MTWKRGQSGNPGGRPKEFDEIKSLARKSGPDAIRRLVDWMRSDNPKASVAASQALLDRGYGKPDQHIEAAVEHKYVAETPLPVADLGQWQQQHANLKPTVQ